MVKRLSNTDQNSKKLQNLAAPVSANDAVTKAYVDGPGIVHSTTTNKLTISATAPTSPSDKDIWYDTSASSTTTLVSQMLDQIYPIGGVYISGTGTIPPMIAAIGTWASLEGRVIVGKASAGTFSTVGATGGAETHLLTAAESGLPSHYHTLNQISGGAGGGNLTLPYGSGTTYVNNMQTNNSGAANASTAHNNLQPYKVKYMWERTA